MNIAWSPEAIEDLASLRPISRRTIPLLRGGSCCTSYRTSSSYSPIIPRSAEPDACLAPANWSLQARPISSPIGSGAPQSRSYASIMGRGVGLTAFDWPAAASRKTSRRSSLPVGTVAVPTEIVVSFNLAGRRLTTGRPTSPGFGWGSVSHFRDNTVAIGDQNRLAAGSKPNIFSVSLFLSILGPTERMD